MNSVVTRNIAPLLCALLLRAMGNESSWMEEENKKLFPRQIICLKNILFPCSTDGAETGQKITTQQTEGGWVFWTEP
jgi:hypothetical protein